MRGQQKDCPQRVEMSHTISGRPCTRSRKYHRRRECVAVVVVVVVAAIVPVVKALCVAVTAIPTTRSDHPKMEIAFGG